MDIIIDWVLMMGGIVRKVGRAVKEAGGLKRGDRERGRARRVPPQAESQNRSVDDDGAPAVGGF